MLEQLYVLFLPFLVCVILTGIHGYLGIHVLARKVIFVDLAMAQIAALGATVAFLLGYDPRSQTAYFLSLGFTLAGAAVFAATRTRRERVPQEAVIGLVYAIASAAAILVADQAAHGTEHLKDLLAGSIVWVTQQQVLKTFVIYSALGAFHFAFRRQFLLISTDPEAAMEQGLRVRFWDFLFYLSFGLVITSSVQIAGVLLVFCYLIAPAVCAMMFADRTLPRLAIGWTVGVVCSAVGLLFSYDRPSGPTIICFFALFLAEAASLRAVWGAASRARAGALYVALHAVALGGGYEAWRAAGPRHEKGEHAGHGHGEAEHGVGDTLGDLLKALADDHPNVRAEAAEALGRRKDPRAVEPLARALSDPSPAVKEKAARALAAIGDEAALPALRAAAEAPEEDEWVTLEAARAAASLGDAGGLGRLVKLAAEADAKVARAEALNAALALFGRDGLQPGAAAGPEGKRAQDDLERWLRASGNAPRFDRQRRVFLVP